MPIEVGARYKFDYPPVFKTLPEYTAHMGQQVTVLRELIDGEEYDREDGEYAFWVKADDGWEGMAYESELLAPGEARKWE